MEEHRGRLILVWPVATHAALTRDADIAHLRADRPLATPPLSATSPLAPWLSGTIAASDELLLRLRPGTTASLLRPHPRLTVIEFQREPVPRAAPPPTPPPAALTPGTPSSAALIEPAAGAAWIVPVPRSRPEPEIAPPPAVAAGEPTPPDQVEAVQAEDDADADRSVTVTAKGGPDALELHFRWGAAVPAAMFQRGNGFWAVFPHAGARVAGWRSLARPEVTRWLVPLATAAAGDARQFRFDVVRPIRIEPRPTPDGWSVRVTAGDATAVAGEGSPWHRDPEHGQLEVATQGKVAQVRDPSSGERFVLLLAPEVGLRQPEAARLVDLELLPSLQGLVWRPLSDGMAATVAAGRLTVTRPGGLRLSAGAVEHPPADPDPVADSGRGTLDAAVGADKPDDGGLQAPVSPVPASPPPDRTAALGLEGLSTLGASGRQDARARLLGELRDLPGTRRAEARLDLARLYLADALGPEARTALELIDDGALAAPAAAPARRARLALTGAAEALTGRQDPALASLLDHTLDEDGEIALWRAYAAALAARWRLATQEWRRSGGVPPAYPDPLRRRLGLELAAALLDHGGAGEARALLHQLAGIGLSGGDGARLRLLEGIAQSREGRPREAEAAFTAAAAGGDGDVATRARFLLISTKADEKSLTAAAAATALDEERRHWRGHAWEPRMLRRLAELQAAAGRWIEAISTERDAIARTTDPAEAAEAALALRGQLASLLSSDTIPPLARLAIHRAHGALLDAGAATAGLNAALGEVAVRNGLTETAAALLDAAPAPAADAGNVALAGVLTGRGDLDAALRRLAQVSHREDVAGLDRELRARAALAAGDPMGAAATLHDSDPASGSAGALELEIAARRSDWEDLARLAGADLAAAAPDASLEGSRAEAAIWLGLAQTRLARHGAAAAVAKRYAAGIQDPELAGLMRLATMAEPDGRADGTSAGRFAEAIRRELVALPSAAADASGDALRTASARSGPTG